MARASTTLNMSSISVMEKQNKSAEGEHGENLLLVLLESGLNLDNVGRVTAAQSSVDEAFKAKGDRLATRALPLALAAVKLKDTPPTLLSSAQADAWAGAMPDSSGVGISPSIQVSDDEHRASDNVGGNSAGTQVSDDFVTIVGDMDEGGPTDQRPTEDKDTPSVSLELVDKNQLEPDVACMSAATEVADEDQPPDVNKKSITQNWKIKKVGEGRNGTCYVVEEKDVTSGKRFCLKVPNHDKFVGTEIYCLTKLQGIPGVVEYYGWLPYEKKACLLMEYIPEILAQKAENSFSETSGLCMLEQVLRCVNAMYTNGITHCDIKEENIGIVEDRIVLFDFGQAETQEKLTAEKFHEAMLFDVRAAVLMFDRLTEESTNHLVKDLRGAILEADKTAEELLAYPVFHQ